MILHRDHGDNNELVLIADNQNISFYSIPKAASGKSSSDFFGRFILMSTISILHRTTLTNQNLNGDAVSNEHIGPCLIRRWIGADVLRKYFRLLE